MTFSLKTVFIAISLMAVACGLLRFFEFDAAEFWLGISGQDVSDDSAWGFAGQATRVVAAGGAFWALLEVGGYTFAAISETTNRA